MRRWLVLWLSLLLSLLGLAVVGVPAANATSQVGLRTYDLGPLDSVQGLTTFAYGLPTTYDSPTCGYGSTSMLCRTRSEPASRRAVPVMTGIGVAETPISIPRLGVAAKAEVGGGGQVFTQGGNDFLARAPGDNFVTDLGVGASSRQLEGIGVFGAKQQYAIQFSQEAALNSGVRPVMVRQSIFTIPGGSCISGACVVTRVR